MVLRAAPPQTQDDLIQLSVFEGSFDLSAALDVLAPRGVSTADALDRISPLIDVALVDLSALDPQEPLLRIPELVRSFPRARMAACADADAVRRRHVAHFQKRCESTRPLRADEIGDILTALDRAILDSSPDQALHATVAAATALSTFRGAVTTLEPRLDELVESAGGDHDATGEATGQATLARALTWSAIHGDGGADPQPYAQWLGTRITDAVDAARR